MGIKNSITPEEVVDLLNEVLKLDEEAVTVLFRQKIPCNKRLLHHPTVQCRAEHGKLSSYTISPLGIINGLFGIDKNEMGAIYREVDMDDNEKLIKFGLVKDLSTDKE